MKRAAFLLGILVLVATPVVGRTGEPAPPSSPTFTKDVAPILFSRCVQCHRPGEIGPMSLLSYQEVRPWAKAIRSKVVAREMPPWGADPQYGRFKNDPTLSQAQIETIVAWVEAGAPKGSDADMPSAPALSAGWLHGEPDLVLEMPIEFQVPAEGQVDVTNLYMKVPFKEDVFIKALEIRPTAPGVVHHGGVYTVDRLPEGATIVDGNVVGRDGKQISRAAVSRANGRRAFEENDKLLSIVPGRGYETYQEGAGQRIKGDSYIYFNMHYQPTGKPERDKTKIGLYLAKPGNDVTHQIYHGWRSAGPTSYIVEGKELATDKGSGDDGDSDSDLPPIPPYAENFTVVSIHAITEPITVYGLTPHLHLRGKSMKYTLTWPDGREEVLLSVPKYDFNWQIYYELEAPKQIAAGSKVTVTTIFDNSARNINNPAPDKQVWWSDQSWDEMYAPQVRFTMDNRPLPKR
jgi:mono/diheme cytochrome c family protein